MKYLIGDPKNFLNYFIFTKLFIKIGTSNLLIKWLQTKLCLIVYIYILFLLLYMRCLTTQQIDVWRERKIAMEAVIYQQDPFIYGYNDYTYNTELVEFGIEEKGNVDKTRGKRRRGKPSMNKEELETKRMTHIAAERNRRRQMNDYLAVLRSLMPPSYSQRVNN